MSTTFTGRFPPRCVWCDLRLEYVGVPVCWITFEPFDPSDDRNPNCALSLGGSHEPLWTDALAPRTTR